MSEAEASVKSASEQPQPQVKQRRLAAFTVAVLCLVAGSALGLLIVPRAPTPRAANAAAPEVSYLGEALSLQKEPQKVALRKGRSFLSRTFVLALPDNKSQELSLQRWGATLDEPRLTHLILDLGDSSSPTRRLLEDREVTTEKEEPLSPLVLPSAIALDPEEALSELMRVKDRVDRPSRDARLDLESGEVRAHQSGRWLDVDATLLAMDQALSEGLLRSDAVLLERAPNRRSEELKDLKFPSVLGHFETRYSRTKKAADRTFNLRLAAERLDGAVVMPGETFDFNAVVGPRDEAAGYKVATVIANGELVDGIGGGTCQISGTLHGAAFFAGLEIIERYPHTRPSSYIKMGMDATVVYPTINFRVKNPYSFPIVLHQTVEEGVVRAEVLGQTQDQVVSLIRKVDRAIPYEQIERQDSTLPKGTSILAQRGVPGFRLHRYRTIRRGSHTQRERWRDVYPPTNQVIRVGSGPPSLKKRSSVSTPEYQADEVLILTQRRPVGGQPGEFAENREKGRYGTKGWTREAGMRLWDSRD